MGHITVDTLRDWLAEHKPVTVFDVRTQKDRDQWSIPGSMHLNTYESLKQGVQVFSPPSNHLFRVRLSQSVVAARSVRLRPNNCGRERRMPFHS